MAKTSISTSDNRAVKQYQQERIAEEQTKFDTLAMRGMVGEGTNNVLMVENALSKGKGDNVDYYLEMKLVGQGVIEGQTARGREEKIVHYVDTLRIGEIFHAILLEGKMSEQRTKIDLRRRAPRALGRWGGEWLNELFWIMMTGERGTNVGKMASDFSGFGGNSLVVADSDHVQYANDATSKSDIDATDTFSLTEIERLTLKSETLSPQVSPLQIDGEGKWMMGLHPYSKKDLRTNTSTGQWLDLQKAVTQGGGKGLYYKNSLGEYNNTILFTSQDVRTYSNFGSGANVAGVANIFFGAQAGVIANGKGYEGNRWDYVEITEDYERETGFGTGLIVGMKPCIFNSKRFGMIVNYCAGKAA